jgi:type I restriction enzyme S subunit
MINLIENNVRSSNTLADIRDALLPRLMSGEIRVRDAEKVVEAAV